MRDRVLDSNIVWVAPEESPEGTPAESDEVVGLVERPLDRDGSDDGISEADTESREWVSDGGDLFGGFGVDGGGFDQPGFHEDPDSLEPPHHWAVPWSDLMMVMFVLFAVMVAKQTDQSPIDTPPQETAETVAEKDRIVKPFGEPMMTINVLERAQRVVKESDADDVDIVLMDDQSVKVSVRGPMLFELGSVELRPEVTQFLDDLAGIIRMTPYRIEVIGHTDDRPVATPQFPSNWELSTARASRVVRYLIESGRMAPQRFTVIGRAEYDPITSNQSAADRSGNRRVEILITRDVLPSSEVAIQ